ncbi:MAG: hypothetical protein NZM11_13255, partial [Anaerolineales bacterium]|nr:hypothetical protein [Anaerolineales bacterium]
MVEQVRHHDKQHRLAALDAAVGDGGGQVRLARAATTVQHQPTLGRLGVGPRGLKGVGEALLVQGVRGAALRDEGGKGHTPQEAKVAVALQPRRA